MTEEAVTQETETAAVETPVVEGAQNEAEKETLQVNPTEPVADAEEPAPVEEPQQPAVETIPATETLESYFREELADKNTVVLDFALRAQRTPDGDITFYIHPQGKDGKTRDFLVMGEVARNVTRITM